MRNSDLFEAFEKEFKEREILRKEQIDTFIIKTKGVTGPVAIDRTFKLLMAEGLIKHHGLNTWRNMSHWGSVEESKKAVDARRFKYVCERSFRTFNDDAILTYWKDHGKKTIEPESCPQGIKRVIRSGNISDKVKTAIFGEVEINPDDWENYD